MDAIYMDNNATTRTAPSVVEAMLPYFSESFGNPASHHSFGGDAAAALERARRSLQELIGSTHGSEIVFTSGGTESDNLALNAALDVDASRNEIVVSAVEHPAILVTAQRLAATRGAVVRTIGVTSDGALDLDAYAAALSPRTAIVSMMAANNETGVVFPIVDLARMARAHGVLFHTDAVQAVGKSPISVSADGVDMLSLSAHKLHGPKGVGALFVRKGIRIAGMIVGGRQQGGRRGGTENIPGIVGLGAASALAGARLADDSKRIAALRDRLETEVRARIGSVRIAGEGSARLCNTSALLFDCADSEAVLHLLNKAGVAASSGAACASGAMEPSHVLRAMGVPQSFLHGAIRFSLSRETTMNEIERVIEVLPAIVQSVREKSALWRSRATIGA